MGCTTSSSGSIFCPKSKTDAQEELTEELESACTTSSSGSIFCPNSNKTKEELKKEVKDEVACSTSSSGSIFCRGDNKDKEKEKESNPEEEVEAVYYLNERIPASASTNTSAFSNSSYSASKGSGSTSKSSSWSSIPERLWEDDNGEDLVFNAGEFKGPNKPFNVGVR